MNTLDLEIQAVIKAIEAAGGRAMVSPNSPDYMKRAFLDMIFDCPECRQAVIGKHGSAVN